MSPAGDEIYNKGTSDFILNIHVFSQLTTLPGQTNYKLSVEVMWRRYSAGRHLSWRVRTSDMDPSGQKKLTRFEARQPVWLVQLEEQQDDLWPARLSPGSFVGVNFDKITSYIKKFLLDGSGSASLKGFKWKSAPKHPTQSVETNISQQTLTVDQNRQPAAIKYRPVPMFTSCPGSVCSLYEFTLLCLLYFIYFSLV